ncbi:unnamed protein product [Rotaria magnacalcarata]|uniref:ATP-dependent DNA helicase n=3 Tax=Rotaria magnacalcarata TaxID=392030 RepID=A0A815PAY8_9BILA|nr:unnamed protein product [Rotaria magnacalcarata]
MSPRYPYITNNHIPKHIIFSGDNSGQLIMCMPGCGGTGKSQLICVLTKYFLVIKRTQMARKLAPTEIAAAEIGGMTIHSFLGEQRDSGKSRTIKAGDLKLEKEWRFIEYLLIDEMSMVDLTLLAKLNRIISAAKHVDPQIPFGGVNVIFFGDYLQYRPVYDAPLHTDFPLLSKNKSTKKPTEKEIQQRVACSLILQINCVVKLTQQMRTEDIRYLQLLERLRHGQCNYDDYELLMTRVVGQPSVGSLRDSPWNKAPILVFRNEVQTQLNFKAAIHNATQSGCTPTVCVAQDTCKGKPIEDPTLMKKLLELSDSKTEHLPGLLPFVPGMPVILTQNIAIELGLINGINGIVRQLVYQSDSMSTDVLSQAFPNNTQYVHRPLYALIEIARSKIECNLEELQPKLVPIPLMEQTFRVDVTDILPKGKKSTSNGKAILSIKRRALPFVPAYCIAAHKSQDQTLNKVVIDLKVPNETDDIVAVYVPLSRVKRLADLIILRQFDYKTLLIKPIGEFERKAEKIFSDTNAFIELSYNPFNEILNKVIQLLNTLRGKDLIRKWQYEQMMPDRTKCELAHLYFNPKTHKDGIPVRPIENTIHASTTKISKFLDKILRPIFDDKCKDTTIIDGASLITELSKYNKKGLLKPTTLFCTFDIRNLYTMLPQEETLDILMTFLHAHGYRKVKGISIDTIKRLASIILKDNVFAYVKKIYKQTTGGAMGSSLTLTLANIFMSISKKILLKNKRRQVNFMEDYKIGNSLPFLDVQLINNNGILSTCVYHKPAAEPYVTPFISDHPRHAFSNIIKTFIERAARYSSTFEAFNYERHSIKLMLLYNEYPSTFIENEFHKYFSEYISKSPFLPLLDDERKYFMRKQILGQPTPRQTQVALSAALADIDNDPLDDDERQQPNPDPKKSEEKNSNINEKFFTHYTYEKRFKTCKRDMHQVYYDTFKDTPAMYTKLIVGNRIRHPAHNELIRKRPNKTLLQNTTTTKSNNEFQQIFILTTHISWKSVVFVLNFSYIWMSYDPKYAQNKGKCKGHWKGTPLGSSYTGGVCWACSKGCAALSVLALKGLDPNKDNITYHLNDNADVIWSKAGYKKQESKIPSSFPCIAKLSNRQHYVILTGNADNKGYNAWDPSGGKVKTFDSKQIGPIFA